jgi:hypothetical protein
MLARARRERTTSDPGTSEPAAKPGRALLWGRRPEHISRENVGENEVRSTRRATARHARSPSLAIGTARTTESASIYGLPGDGSGRVGDIIEKRGTVRSKAGPAGSRDGCAATSD